MNQYIRRKDIGTPGLVFIIHFAAILIRNHAPLSFYFFKFPGRDYCYFSDDWLRFVLQANFFNFLGIGGPKWRIWFVDPNLLLALLL